MKYPGVTLGRIEAVWNKLGGEDGVSRFLRGETTVAQASTKFGKLTAVCVHTDKDVLTGDEYLCRARKESRGRSTQEAFDFYAKLENWHLLPDKDKDGNTVEYLVFPDSEFDSGDYRYVRYLCRYGAEWGQDYYWVGYEFNRLDCVAVLAS